MDDKVNNGVAEVVVEAPKETNVKITEMPSKKSSKELRKIDDKSVEQVLKALSSLQTPEEKLAAMCKKYTEIVDENRKLLTSKQWEKKYVLVQREKEQIQLEYNKTILLKVKLESLCRELQKQNKAVKDESLLKIREEEERRKETQAKFQNTLTEITTLMQQNNEKNTKLRDDNLDMTKKFKSVVEQYELREQQVDKMAKQMALEAQLAEAKLNKANLEAQADREKMLAEKKQLLLELSQYQSRCTEMQATEVALRCQVSMYTDKYDEFQNALTRSNEVFGGFKGEMEKMSKKILKLEKETTVWKQRWEKSHAALLDMAAEKQQRDASAALQARQLLQVQRLCRTMQAERGALLNTLKENNIERPPLPQLPPEPEAAPESVDIVDAMAANCAQLKQSLAQLQGQLDVLTANSGNAEDGQSKSPDKTTSADDAVAAGAQKGKVRKGKGKKSRQNDSLKEQAKDMPTDIVSQSIEPIEPENTESKKSEVEVSNEITTDSVTEEKSEMSDEVKLLDEKLYEEKLLENTVSDEKEPDNRTDAEKESSFEEKLSVSTIEEVKLSVDATNEDKNSINTINKNQLAISVKKSNVKKSKDVKKEKQPASTTNDEKPLVCTVDEKQLKNIVPEGESSVNTTSEEIQPVSTDTEEKQVLFELCSKIEPTLEEKLVIDSNQTECQILDATSNDRLKEESTIESDNVVSESTAPIVSEEACLKEISNEKTVVTPSKESEKITTPEKVNDVCTTKCVTEEKSSPNEKTETFTKVTPKSKKSKHKNAAHGDNKGSPKNVSVNNASVDSTKCNAVEAGSNKNVSVNNASVDSTKCNAVEAGSNKSNIPAP